jgi:hypothetical protein
MYRNAIKNVLNYFYVPYKVALTFFSQVGCTHFWIPIWIGTDESKKSRIHQFPDPLTSVADPGCLSRILIFTHPGSRIPDPKTAAKERGEKKCCHTFFCSHKFHIIENYFIFEMLKTKNLGQFS